MTNRETYTLFTDFEDEMIFNFLDEHKKVIILVSENPFRLYQTIVNNGRVFSLSKIGNINSVFSQFINKDTPDLKTFVKNASKFFEIKREQVLKTIIREME